MEMKYAQISPEGMFKVVVERIIIHDTPMRMHYEYKYVVETRQTQNDFVNMFVALVVRHGKCPASVYAKLMGLEQRGMMTTLITLTGVGINEWTDAFAAAISETLLRETKLPVGKIAVAAGWDLKANGLSILSRWFINRYGCSPLKWRRENSTPRA
jgi:transcriptional regulator GlxA family with amidase domain